MKKALLCLFMVLSIVVSCGPTKKVVTDDATNTEVTLGTSYMRFTMNRVLGISQLDSMIVVDNLATLDKWLCVPIGNSSNKINQYMYIKSLDVDNELIYTATQINRDTLYKCTKRITEKIVE